MMGKIETAARSRMEAMTRNLVLRRKLPREFGSVGIFVSPSGGLKYVFKPMEKIDEALLSLAAEFVRPGDVVWDVGANVGLFSFAAAWKSGPTGKVVAFEPDSWLVRLLRHSASRLDRHCSETMVVPVAVSCEAGLASFEVARSRAKSSLAGYGYSTGAERVETQFVPTVTLDLLSRWLPTPDVVKIDVEGAEAAVLKGGRGLLDAKRPIVICEVGEASRNEVTEILRRQRYTLYDCDDRSRPRQPLDAAAWNTLAIPPDRASPPQGI